MESVINSHDVQLSKLKHLLDRPETYSNGIQDLYFFWIFRDKVGIESFFHELVACDFWSSFLWKKFFHKHHTEIYLPALDHAFIRDSRNQRNDRGRVVGTEPIRHVM